MVKYLFISTDSTYDSSAFLLDQHRHKFVPSGFLKPDQPAKPKLPKGDSRLMYKQAYGALIEQGGITEECTYSPALLESVSSAYKANITPDMQASMQGFLKPLDSYGYNKIICEELLTREAADHNL